MQKIICEVADNGAVSVRLIGEHMNKRILLRALKAIKLKYRQSIIMYRRGMIADRAKAEQEARKFEQEETKRETEKITEGVIENGEHEVTKPE